MCDQLYMPINFFATTILYYSFFKNYKILVQNSYSCEQTAEKQQPAFYQFLSKTNLLVFSMLVSCWLQVLQMERLILRTLSFNIASPTVNCFCSNLLTNLVANEKTSSLAMVRKFVIFRELSLSNIGVILFADVLHSCLQRFISFSLGKARNVRSQNNVGYCSFAFFSDCIKI